MGKIEEIKAIVDAILWHGQGTGEIIHVDGGSHAGRW
jgi:hypothetical protein